MEERWSGDGAGGGGGWGGGEGDKTHYMIAARVCVCYQTPKTIQDRVSS